MIGPVPHKKYEISGNNFHYHIRNIVCIRELHYRKDQIRASLAKHPRSIDNTNKDELHHVGIAISSKLWKAFFLEDCILLAAIFNSSTVLSGNKRTT